jgi:hypothetical protein
VPDPSRVPPYTTAPDCNIEAPVPVPVPVRSHFSPGRDTYTCYSHCFYLYSSKQVAAPDPVPSSAPVRILLTLNFFSNTIRLARCVLFLTLIGYTDPSLSLLFRTLYTVPAPVPVIGSIKSCTNRDTCVSLTKKFYFSFCCTVSARDKLLTDPDTDPEPAPAGEPVHTTLRKTFLSNGNSVSVLPPVPVPVTENKYSCTNRDKFDGLTLNFYFSFFCNDTAWDGLVTVPDPDPAFTGDPVPTPLMRAFISNRIKMPVLPRRFNIIFPSHYRLVPVPVLLPNII